LRHHREHLLAVVLVDRGVSHVDFADHVCAHRSNRTAIPSAAMMTTSCTSPRCRTKASSAAMSASAETLRSMLAGSNAYQRSGPARASATLENSTCSANHTV